ncbi:MAG: sugar nucleotide-binding protein [Roseiflexaceae bacterium]|nr:sugar nucleotide-binding protein [Roseiflexus sp.]MDW8145298.1 sugar nucleotide-binding protein [Roseiflexaceae bacterium]MDW8232054.1 sugar nucleotide-binding protein [Roseiflexaceae bacterium]
MLITGGSGFLGSALTDLARTQGWNVVATYHSRRPPTQGVHWEALDLRDGAATTALIERYAPDIVIHTAYRQEGPDMAAITVDGARAVAQGAYAVRARLIHLSSDVVFDGERIGRYSEADTPQPVTAYGAAKAAAERLVAAAHPAALIVRTSLIYGGPERPGRHEQFVLDVIDGRAEAIFFTDELRCPIEVGDLAAALLELATLNRSGILHVAGPDIVSRYEFACMVARAFGRDPARVRGGPSPAALRRPRNCALDSRIAQSVLTTRIRGVREVLG